MVARRRKKRRFSSANAIMKRRMGAIGWGGSKPFFSWSKTITTKTLGEGHNPGGTMGALFHLPVNNWNDPLGNLATLVAGTGSLTSNRHPEPHLNAIAVGYNRVNVISWKAEIDVNWIAPEGASNDFVVAYTFKQEAVTELTLATGPAGRIEVLELKTNPRWTISRVFNAHHGHDTGKKKSSKVVINVPNVFKYCEFIAGGQTNLLADNGSTGHAIKDTGFTSNVPIITLFCTVAIFTLSGLTMLIDSIHVTVAITQKVKIYRDFLGDEDMDDGETDVHA